MFFALTLLSISAKAQNEGIKFLDNPKWNEVLEIAAKENKLIFIDCYTTWCGPCKALAKDVFPQKNVGDYMNPKFINVKMDMEKGDGIELHKRYKKYIPGFPTMMIINSKGEVLHEVVGYKSPEELIKAVQSGMDGKTVSAMEGRYANGERTPQFIKEYLEVLNTAFKRDEMAQLAIDYVKGLPADDLKKQDIIEIYIPYIKDVYSPEYEFIMKNTSHFNYRMDKSFDRYVLNDQLNNAMSRAVKDIIEYKDDKPLDPAKDKIEKIRSFFKRYTFKNQQMYEVQLKIHEMNAEGNYKKAMEYIGWAVELDLLGYGERSGLVKYANFFVKNCSDKNLLKQYVAMMEADEASISLEKRNEEFMLYRALSDIYTKIGDKKKAASYGEIATKGENIIKEKYKDFLKEQ